VFSLDVSGHGISSALMTARLAGFLSSSVPQQNIGLGPDGTALRPDRIAARLNEIALREFDGGHYFTLALADLDLRDGHLRLVQAGHPHPLIQRAEGRIDMLGQGGFPVGLIDDAGFEMIEARLNPGDRLILASDGVTECADPQGTLLGDEGFIRMLETLAEVPGRRLLETIAWKLADRTAEDRFEDDVSAISLEYLRPG
jgi:sigma-B regulation protein RsbU (phosphoserine phosphatase)